MLGTILSTVGSLATSWLSNKAEESKAKHERKLEVIKQTTNWEDEMANGSKSSWKDEWFTILFSIPCIMAFFPELVPYVEQGFKVLEGMPDWYKAFLGAAVAASFGIRSLTNWKGK
jgi:hypothetical protein